MSAGEIVKNVSFNGGECMIGEPKPTSISVVSCAGEVEDRVLHVASVMERVGDRIESSKGTVTDLAGDGRLMNSERFDGRCCHC